MFNADDAI